MATNNYWWMALNAVEQKIRSLQLNGISPDDIRIQDVGLDRDFNGTGISISPYGAESADPESGTNASDDFVYPILVMIIDKRGGISSLEDRLLWRQQIIDAMQHKGLTYNGNAVAGHYDTNIKPGRVADLMAYFERQRWTSSFLVSWKQRRARP